MKFIQGLFLFLGLLASTTLAFPTVERPTNSSQLEARGKEGFSTNLTLNFMTAGNAPDNCDNSSFHSIQNIKYGTPYPITVDGGNLTCFGLSRSLLPGEELNFFGYSQDMDLAQCGMWYESFANSPTPDGYPQANWQTSYGVQINGVGPFVQATCFSLEQF